MGECFFSSKTGQTYYCSVTGQECIRESGTLCPWLCMQSRARQSKGSAEQQTDNTGSPKLPLLNDVESYIKHIYGLNNQSSDIGELLTGAQLTYDYIERQLRAGA